MPGPTFIESYERTWWAASFWDPLRTGVLALRLHALPRVSRPEAALMSLSPGDGRGFFYSVRCSRGVAAVALLFDPPIIG
jgi:hypothetical protein